MEDASLHVTQLLNQACSQYPGGLRAVFAILVQRSSRTRAESTLYADFNPHPTSAGKLKVEDMITAMTITGDHGALFYLASYFGYSLTPLSCVEPDAPTLEGEMLQDYPAVVAFHEAVKEYQRGAIDYETVLARLEGAALDLRQTAAMAKDKRADSK